ncbi:hypothetical protein D3C85_1202030 [compost metagenome]
MPYLAMFFAGLFGLLTVKVPEGTNPFVFYMGSALIAMVVFGTIMLGLRLKRPQALLGALGCLVFVGLMVTAITIVSRLPAV